METYYANHLRAERDLRGLLVAVEDLFDVAKEWEGLPDYERAFESFVWDRLAADRLAELDGYHRAGALSLEQDERYGELRSRLREARPIIEGLNFGQPAAWGELGDIEGERG